MIISPPFLPAAGLTAADNAANLPRLDPMMDLVDTFELAHGTYPIAFDRRWHCGVHLMPTMQNEKVRAIADGDVVACRISRSLRCCRSLALAMKRYGVTPTIVTGPE
ncbi:hypothetical protein [Caballeronia sp. GAFFF3]|uniref:hypothetical protein n=1 Tax=Caballeronia sp. GAFFF3 TaxID=2921759 RepID=UPI0032ED2F73